MSEAPRARPGRKPNVETVIETIKAGDYDEHLIEMLKAIDSRRIEMQEQVRKLVKQVFGADADVHIPEKMDLKPSPMTREEELRIAAQAPPKPRDPEPSQPQEQPQPPLEPEPIAPPAATAADVPEGVTSHTFTEDGVEMEVESWGARFDVPPGGDAETLS